MQLFYRWALLLKKSNRFKVISWKTQPQSRNCSRNSRSSTTYRKWSPKSEQKTLNLDSRKSSWKIQDQTYRRRSKSWNSLSPTYSVSWKESKFINKNYRINIWEKQLSCWNPRKIKSKWKITTLRDGTQSIREWKISLAKICWRKLPLYRNNSV